MKYDKPKVTIDLDEYMELKRKADAQTSALPYRQAFATFLNNGGNLAKTNEELFAMCGLEFIIIDSLRVTGNEKRDANCIIVRNKKQQY